ncbi:MAG: acylneuraminate cytidylyltransferase family protein [Candidatus Sungbacteria bacterium]|nr:acylneuraminate cytidylyltransferase family protein [Candidatus Sungbacteria bacterium]
MADSKKKILGIIPARGGSKSIPRKNIKPFLGKPLIAWAIEALKESGVCDRVVVSTDDKEIADIAKKFGAEVPFMRPAEFAQDTSPTLPVLQHAVKVLKENEDWEPKVVILTQATTPGVPPACIKDGFNLFLQSNADSVISLVEVPGGYSPHWQFNLQEGSRAELFVGGSVKNVIRRRQDLPKTYIRNSAFYIFKTALLFEEDQSFYGNDVRGFVMDVKYSVDIDTPEDWEISERQLKKILEEEK